MTKSDLAFVLDSNTLRNTTADFIGPRFVSEGKNKETQRKNFIHYDQYLNQMRQEYKTPGLRLMNKV